MREVDVPRARPRLSSTSRARMRRCARQPTLWLADNIDMYEGEMHARASTRRRRRAFAAIGQIVRVVTTERSRPSRRPAAAGEHGALLEPGAARRALRVPDRVGPLRRSRFDPRLERLGLRGRRHAAFPAARAAPSALSSSTAIPAWSRSIRAGTRPRCGSSNPGFLHILDGTDHLLFLLCLVIPFRRFGPLVADRHRRSPSRIRSR